MTSPKITIVHSTGSKAKASNGRKFKALMVLVVLTPVAVVPPKKVRNAAGDEEVQPIDA